MNKDELKKLDERLAAEEEELLKQLKDLGVENPAVKGDFEVQKPEYGTDETDDANETADFERNLAIERELENRMRQIQDARKKIQEGTYGNCEDCSVKIPPQRLNAIPLASLCVSCAGAKKL
jgi:DnaK suppressor protein